MGKRGMSGVILTIIMIGLVLVATALVWAVILNILSDKTEDISGSSWRLNLKIVKYENDGSGNLKVFVERGVGQGALAGIDFVVVYKNGSIEKISKDSALGELESSSFILMNLAEIATVSLAPVVLSSSGERLTQNIVDVVEIGEVEEEVYVPVCGDGIVEGTEVCDDGINNGAYDGCMPGCSSLGPYCGDSIKNGVEECDGGLDCLADCTLKIFPCGGSDLTSNLELLGNPFKIKFSLASQSYYRNVWDMKVFDNKLYLGHGDIGDNVGPTDIWYYNISSETFVKEFTVSEDQISKYKIIDGKLHIPGDDPVGTGRQAYYKLENGNWIVNLAPPLEYHYFDIEGFNGDLFLGVGPYSPNSGLIVSHDGGVSWPTLVIQNENGIYSRLMGAGRIHTLFVLNNTMYGSGYRVYYTEDLKKSIVAYLTRYDGNNQVTIVNQTIAAKMLPGFAANQYPRLKKPAYFNNYLVYIGGYGTTEETQRAEKLFKSNSIGTTQQITLKDNARPWDILVSGNKIYVLGQIYYNESFSINTVSSSSDLINWNEEFRFNYSTFARSFELKDDVFYFGIGTDVLEPAESNLIQSFKESGNILRLDLSGVCLI